MDDVAIFDSALPDAAIPQAMLGDFKSNHSGLCVRASEIPVPPPKHEPGTSGLRRKSTTLHQCLDMRACCQRLWLTEDVMYL
jgi:hypothetical protein